MTTNVIRNWVKIPQSDSYSSERIQIGQGSNRSIRRQNENRCIREVPVAVSLSHASPPVLELHLKCADSGAQRLNEILTSGGNLIPAQRFPCNREQIRYAKTVYRNLTGTDHFELLRAMVDHRDLLDIRPCKLDREPSFCSRRPEDSPWQVALRLSESDLWHLDCCCTAHATRVPVSRFQHHQRMRPSLQAVF